ncbi:MAG: ChbG/HpnK family deacetylase [Phycisphaerae bacterium]
MDTFLIINADDFGWTEGINEGIIEAHRHGILTSATLLANTKATAHAVKLAKSFPKLSVGVHLSYGLGEPLLPISELDALYDPDGNPKFSTPALWLAATLRKKVRCQLDKHFRSQIEAVSLQGVNISHLDTHKHLHFWPSVFEIVARIAADFRIPALRLIKENPIVPGPPVLKTRSALLMLYWTYYVNMSKAKKYGLLCPHRFVGIIQTGYWTKQIFMDTARSLKPGVTEIMTHPGHSVGLENEPTRLVESRQAELDILKYPLIKEYFHQCQQKVKLIGYRDLPDVR